MAATTREAVTPPSFMPTVALLIVIGTALRVYGLDRQSLWSDELFAVMASYLPHYRDLIPLLLNDSHPPGYVSFMYWTLPLTGYSDAGIRLHALLAGILWIPLVYHLGRRWLSHSAGLFAAALMTGSYAALYYSQEARAYTMLIVCSLVSIHCLMAMVLEDSWHWRHRYGLVIANSIALYLHYSGFVLVCAEVLFSAVLLGAGCGRHCRRWGFVGLLALPLVLYAPWLSVMYRHMTDTSLNWAVSARPGMADVYAVSRRLFGPDVGQTRFFLLVIVLSVIPAFVVRSHRQSCRHLAIFSFLFFLVIFPGVFFLKSILGTPIFEKRYFLLCLPLGALLAGEVVARLRAWLERIMAINIPDLVPCLLLLFWVCGNSIDAGIYTARDKDPVRDAVQSLQQELSTHVGDGDYTVLMTHDWFEHYLIQRGVAFDNYWKGRHMYVAHQLPKLDRYLKKRSNIHHFYYLALRQPGAEQVASGMAQQYRLLKKKSVAIEAGTLDIFHFSAVDPPLDTAADDTVSLAPLFEKLRVETAAAPPDSYSIVAGEDWLLPYLRRHGLPVQEQAYMIAPQLDVIASRLKQSARVETLYYVASRGVGDALLLLLEHVYKDIGSFAVDTPTGELLVRRFAVREPPAPVVPVGAHVTNDPFYQAGVWIARDIAANGGEQRARVAVSADWLRVYMSLAGVIFRDWWASHFYYAGTQASLLLEQLRSDVDTRRFYYASMQSSDTERAAGLLQLRYTLLEKRTFETSLGGLNVFVFDLQSAGGTSPALLQLLHDSPVSRLIQLIQRREQQYGGGRVTFLMTHDWFELYLQAYGLRVDERQRDKFYYAPSQVDAVTGQVRNDVGADRVYYLALNDESTQLAIDALAQHMALVCESRLDAAADVLRLLEFSATGSSRDKPASCGDP